MDRRVIRRGALLSPYVVVAAGVFTVANAHTAFADSTPCTVTHCYAYEQRVTSGIASAHLWEDKDPLLASVLAYPSAHFNSEAWLGLSDGSFVEAGLRYGNDSGSFGSPCNAVCYDVFWAETANGVEYRHIVGETSASGGRIHFAILQDVGYWVVQVNGTGEGTAVHATASTSKRIEIGAELVESTCDDSLSSGDNLNMHAEIASPGGALHDAVWTTSPTKSCLAGSFSASTSGDGYFTWSK